MRMVSLTIFPIDDTTWSNNWVVHVLVGFGHYFAGPRFDCFLARTNHARGRKFDPIMVSLSVQGPKFPSFVVFRSPCVNVHVTNPAVRSIPTDLKEKIAQPAGLCLLGLLTLEHHFLPTQTT